MTARGLVTLLTALGCACAAAADRTSVGPFDIETRLARIGAGGFPNTSANPFARMTVTVFVVRYRGKPVTVTDGKTTIDEFTEAKVLTGAPRPAIVVALAGMYLISEREGQLDVRVLAPRSDDVARWQWLDERDGQPGPEHGVTFRDASGEPRAAAGGRLMLVNRQCVLDVATLASWPIVVNSHENVERSSGYNAGEQARALSPGGTQYVSVGTRYVGERFQCALVAAEYATARVYAVAFDRDALRFESVWDATPQWIARHFEWRRDAGGERLELRKDAKPLPWQGRFSRSYGGMVDYDLYPTKRAMLDRLAQFVRTAFAGEVRADDDHTMTAVVGDTEVRLAYFDSDRRTALFAQSRGPAPPREGWALVEKIGARFNEALARGGFDDLFTMYPPGK